MLTAILMIQAATLGLCGAMVVILFSLAGTIWDIKRQQDAQRANQDDPRY